MRAVIAGLVLLSLLALPFAPQIWGVVLALLLIGIVANWPLLRFLYGSGGLALAVRGGLYHQLYYLYSSAAFAWCLAEWVLRRRGTGDLGA